MRENDVVDGALHSVGSDVLRLGGVVHQCCHADSLGSDLLVVECFVADVVFQCEQVVTLSQCLRSGQRDVEGVGSNGGLANFRRSEVERSLSDKGIGAVGGERHLGHLHGRFCVECLHRDVQHVLCLVARSDILCGGCCGGDAVEVHGLRGEQAYCCLPAIGIDRVAGVAEEDNRQRTIVSGRADDARLALLERSDEIGGINLCAAIYAQFLIVERTMPYLVLREINHHLLAGNTREEGNLTVSLGEDATILSAFVVELERCLIDGDGLRSGGHDGNGGVDDLHGGAGGERSDTVGVSCCHYLCNINLNLCAYGCCAEEVALDGVGVRTVRKSIFQYKSVTAAILVDGRRNLNVALEDFQRRGVHGTLVLRHVEVDLPEVVGVHHARRRHIDIGERHVLLGTKFTANAVVVASCTRDGHVLQRDTLHLGYPAGASLSIAPEHTNRERTVRFI